MVSSSSQYLQRARQTTNVQTLNQKLGPRLSLSLSLDRQAYIAVVTLLDKVKRRERELHREPGHTLVQSYIISVRAKTRAQLGSEARQRGSQQHGPAGK